MKSSLKFTTIALLLSSVLLVPSLSASSASASSVSGSLTDQLSNPEHFKRYANTEEGRRSFITDVTAGDSDIPHVQIRNALAKGLPLSSLTKQFLESALTQANKQQKKMISFALGVVEGSITLREQISPLNQQLAETEASKTQLTLQLTEIQRNLELKIAENDTLKTAGQRAHDEAQESKESHERELEVLQKQISRLGDQKTTLEQSLAETEAMRALQVEQLKHYAEMLDSSELFTTGLRTALEQATAQGIELTDNNSRQKEEISELETTKSQLLGQLHALEQMRQTQLGQITEQKAAIAALQQHLDSNKIRAFSDPSAPSVVDSVELDQTYLEFSPSASKLPTAEQLYLLDIRNKLKSPDALTSALDQFGWLLRLTRNVASDNGSDENLARAAFLVNVLPHVQGIVPVIGGYLQYILGKITEINNNPADMVVSSGWLSSTTLKKLSSLQTLQLQELEGRKNLAYAVFDAVFGTMVKPLTVPAPISFSTDQSAHNILTKKVYDLHATLVQPDPYQKLLVAKDGSIASLGSSDFSTNIDLNTEYMQAIRSATAQFLAKSLGAMQLVGNLFQSTASLTQHADLTQAKASFAPAAAAQSTSSFASGDDFINVEPDNKSATGDTDAASIADTSK